MENKLETITEQFLEECTSTNNIANTLKSLDEITSIENKIIELINNTSYDETKKKLESMLNDWQGHSKEYLKDISLICEEIKEKGYDIFSYSEVLDKSLVDKYGEEFTKKLYLEMNENLIKLVRAVAAYNLYIKNAKRHGLEIKDTVALAKKKEINELYKNAFKTDIDFYELKKNELLELKKYLPVNGSKSKLDEETEKFLEECSYTNNIDASFAALDEITKKEQEIIRLIKTSDDKELNTKFSSMLYAYQKHSKTYINDCLKIQNDLKKKGHALYSIDKKPKEYLINLIRVVARYNLYIKRAFEFNLSVDEKQITEWKKSINILYRKTFDEEKEFYELNENKELDLSLYVSDISNTDEKKEVTVEKEDGLINIGDMLKETTTENKKDEIDLSLYMIQSENKSKELRKDLLDVGEPIIMPIRDYNRERLLINSQIPSKQFVRKNNIEEHLEVPAFINPEYRSAEDYAFYAPIIINEMNSKIRYTASTVDITGQEPDYLLYSYDEPRYVISYNLLLKNNKVVSTYNKEQLQKALNAGGVVISVGTLDGFYKLSDITIVEEEKRKK